MKFFPFTKQSWNSWLATLIGLLAFVSLTGGRIVNPQNIDWLMIGSDPPQQFLGWHFFRNAPLFQLPIGANPSYGLDIGSSIVYTDSIPLLALFFKPFGVILPDTFQYIGIWVLLCFVLQSLFAYKLLSCFTKERWLQLLGCGFFVAAPPFLFRLYAHYALAGQWVLLAGLYFYFSQKFSPLRWMGLLGVTALIQAYLLLMVAALWVVDLSQRIVRKEVKTSQALVFVLGGCAVTATVMWLVGYFMVGGGVVSEGFGYFRMNLLSLIDPDNIWSRVLRDQLGGKGDYEGFNYLGLGVILLGLVACYKAVRTSKLAIDWRTVGPLMLLSFVLTVFAISNHVAFGNHELLVIHLPSIIDRLCNVFRSSGRFFWPVYYALYIGIFYIIVKVLERHLAIALLAVMLCAQVIDSSATFSDLRKKFRDAPTWTSPMRSSFWGGVPSVYKKIIFVLPHNAPDSYLPLAYFAAFNRMAINVGYFSRVDPNKERKAKEEITASVIANELDHDSLFVFEDDGLWRIASSQAASSDAVGIVDGFRVLAPKWKDCTVCDRQAIASIGADKVAEYKKEGIVFTAKGNSKDYVAGGWSSPEEWGTWTDGYSSAVVLQLATLPQTDMFLSIEGHVFVSRKHPMQEVEVVVNRRLLGRLTYTIDAAANWGYHLTRLRVVKIPQVLIAQNDGLLVIQFKLKNPKSPAELGLSGDVRRLGLGLVSLRLDTTS
jgi:hypothetical protein